MQAQAVAISDGKFRVLQEIPYTRDLRHIAQALAIMDLDGVPARVAIARVAPRMQPGTIMTSLKALKGRLRPQLQRALKARKPAL